LHELSIAQGILKAVDDTLVNEPAGHVRSVTVTIGELTVVQEDCLQFAFEAITSGTSKDGVKLIIEFVKPVFRCKECGAEFEPDNGFYTPCPECGKFGVDVVKGNELYVRSLELDKE